MHISTLIKATAWRKLLLILYLGRKPLLKLRRYNVAQGNFLTHFRALIILVPTSSGIKSAFIAFHRSPKAKRIAALAKQGMGFGILKIWGKILVT